jgi:hypothetical protein
MMRRFILAAAVLTLPLSALAQFQTQTGAGQFQNPGAGQFQTQTGMGQTQTGAGQPQIGIGQRDCVQCVSVQSRSVQSDPVQSNCVQCGCVQCGGVQSGGAPIAGQSQALPDFVPQSSTQSSNPQSLDNTAIQSGGN